MKLLRKIKQVVRLPNDLQELAIATDELRQAVGRIERRQCLERRLDDIGSNEFRVYSQWGEDGIVQFLIRHVRIDRKTFVEFGVQNYTQSNTRFLLQNDNWSGLVIDSSADAIRYIRTDQIYWRHNLKAECAFIDRDNINGILEENGIRGDIGLLSIDIDGNDFWVWQAIDCITPRIVICEYNSLFGPRRQVTIPYEASFSRMKAHFSGCYFGASIAALSRLGSTKGYSLVGSTSAGNDLFFVRNDVLGDLPSRSPEQAYVSVQYRESRDEKGNLTFLGFDAVLGQLAEMPLVDLESGDLIRVRGLAAPPAAVSAGEGTSNLSSHPALFDGSGLEKR